MLLSITDEINIATKNLNILVAIEANIRAGVKVATTTTTVAATTTATAATATAATSSVSLATIAANAGTAALTAAATTAATTATISAINTSMNADGDIFKQAKTTTQTSYKDTTSKESLRNIAISAAVAGAAKGAITWANGNPTLESGTYKDSKVGVNTVKGEDGLIYKEAVGQPGVEGARLTAKEMESYNSFGGFGSPYDNNPIFKSINTLPSAPSGAKGHDAWVDALHFEKMPYGGAATAVTALPYLIVNACAAAPSLCAIYVNTKTDNNFLRSND